MDTKLWWQSRTIWVQIVAAAFAVLALFRVLPPGIDQGQVVGAIMLVVAAASAALRVRTTTAIAPAAPAAAPKASPALSALLSPSPQVEPAPEPTEPDQPQETTTMSLKTFLIEAEETAVDALKSAGTVLKSVVVTDVQKAVADGD